MHALRPKPLTLVAVLAAAATCAVRAPARGVSVQGVSAQELSPSRGFVRFDDHLRTPGALVVVGELSRIRQGQRERADDGEADLGVGAVVSRVAGTVYYRLHCRAAVEVREALHGKAGKSVPLAFVAQWSRQPDGSEQLLFRTIPKWKAEQGLVALFVLTKDARTKQWDVRALLPRDPRIDRGPDTEAAFRERAADAFALNWRLARLANALDEAQARREREGAEAAAAVLRSALDEELVLRRADSESPRTMFVAPLEQRVREALARLEQATGRHGERDGADGDEAERGSGGREADRTSEPLTPARGAGPPAIGQR